MLVVKLIKELGPPLLIVLAFDEFFELILLGHFGNSLTLYGVALMLVEIIPVFRHIARPNENFLIRRVIRVSKVNIVLLFEVLLDCSLLGSLTLSGDLFLSRGWLPVADHAIILLGDSSGWLWGELVAGDGRLIGGRGISSIFRCGGGTSGSCWLGASLLSALISNRGSCLSWSLLFGLRSGL